MLKSFRGGFTLAEVLITLGIIGVVAAMTMPTLLNSTNGAQYRTAYKKALSVLSQAVVLNVALDDYDLSQATTSSSTNTASASLYALFRNRMNVVNDSGTNANVEGWSASGDNAPAFGSSATGNYTMFFNDGITFTFEKSAAACTQTKPCKGAIDINGSKNPNKVVACDSASGECKVTNPTDIYPVIMYDQSVLPNSKAARAVLYGGK